MGQLRGGPFDGECRRWSGVLVEAGEGVYRRRGDGDYDFEGHGSWRCSGCGVFVTPGGEQLTHCPFCGMKHLTRR